MKHAHEKVKILNSEQSHNFYKEDKKESWANKDRNMHLQRCGQVLNKYPMSTGQISRESLFV
jgi:hypothetical protein